MKKMMLGTLLFSSSLLTQGVVAQEAIKLPPQHVGEKGSLEAALQARRSVRSFSRSPLSLEQIAQLAWAAQGITSPEGFRTAPSAGALYPLELYLVASRVKGLEPGIYHYVPASHTLQRIASGEYSRDLSSAALNQGAVREAAAVFVIAGVAWRTERKYGSRAERYIYIEAGHAGENLLLQATDLDLGSVIIGAFQDRAVKELLHLKRTYQPISLIAVGRRE